MDHFVAPAPAKDGLDLIGAMAGDAFGVRAGIRGKSASQNGAVRSGEAAAAVSLRSAGMPYLKVGLEVAQAELDVRIALRVDRMLAEGLVAEAERIGPGAVAADAVGYPQALAFLRGESTAAELRASLIRATRRYAKRQLTWFRREPDLVRMEPQAVAGAARDALGWRDS